MLKLVSVALCAAVAATPALAAANEAATPVGDANKVVCKRVKGTGWRLSSTKVCRTKAEWEAHWRAQSEEVRRERQSTDGSPGGN